RRAVERRVLSGFGASGGAAGGGTNAGPARVNALAPLSCVVDLHGFRAAAVALPAFKALQESKRMLRTPTEFLGTVSWLFCDFCGLDGKGGPAKWGFRDVQKLISEHLGLLKAEEPDLSIAGGVLSGDGKIRESHVEEGKDPSSSPPATLVLFPDLLPPEDILSRSSSGAGQPEAVWGAADLTRAVVVPQDSSARLRSFETLDLAVASATIAAAAAEEAADFGEVDRYPPIRPS
ncbi:unnamed protein product, partial [Laminaria digitata]